MSRRYTQQEDDKIISYIDKHRNNLDIEYLAQKLHRTPASVSQRIRTLRTKNQIASFSAEECKLLMKLVKQYVDSDKSVPWAMLADFYFYKPRREPEFLRRKYQLLKKQQEKEQFSSSSSSEAEETQEVPQIVEETSSDQVSSTESGEEYTPATEPSETETSEAENVQQEQSSEDNGLPKPDLDGIDPFEYFTDPEQSVQQTPALRTLPQPTAPHLFSPNLNFWNNEQTNDNLLTVQFKNIQTLDKRPLFGWASSKEVKQPYIVYVCPEF